MMGGNFAERFGTRNVLMTCAMITAVVGFAYLITSKRKPIIEKSW